MKTICPSCEKEREVSFIKQNEELKIKGEKFIVEMAFFKCVVCGEEFDDPKSDHDPIKEAYRLYRERKENKA